MSRWKAAAIHLSISVIIGLLVLAVLFLAWYPQPYFDAAGGQHLIIVLLGVDLVLGPMLTLVLFKSGKKGLIFDLWMIGIVQSAALFYGLFVIAESRPVFVVAAVDRFTVVAAADLDPNDLAEGKKAEFRSLSWTGPRLIAARLPENASERSKLVFSSLRGKDIEAFPKYYLDYDEERSSLLKHARTIASLRKSHPESSQQLDRWFAEHQRSEKDIVWVPIVARRASLTMLMDAKTGEVIEPLPIEPW